MKSLFPAPLRLSTWQILFIPLWCVMLLATVCFSLFTIVYNRSNTLTPASTVALINAQQYNFPDGQVKGLSTVVESTDARAEIIARFLERHNAPLEPYEHFGTFLVELADRHQIDYRLLPAIAMQESNLCKKIPEDSFNCLGFGVHSRGTLKFESYEANFERAARELKANYIEIGLTTPEKIMRKYTPSSNGSWAASVNQWIAEMEYDSREKGREIEHDANLLEYVDP